MFEFRRKLDYLWFPLFWVLASIGYPLLLALLDTSPAIRDGDFLSTLWMFLPIVYPLAQAYVLSLYRPIVLLYTPLFLIVSCAGLVIGSLLGYSFGLAALTKAIGITYGLGYAFMLFMDCGVLSALVIFSLSCLGAWIADFGRIQSSWLVSLLSPFMGPAMLAYPLIVHALFLALPLTLILFLSHDMPRN